MTEEKRYSDEQLDEMFRDSLGEMRVEPSADVWNNVSKKLLRSELGMLNFINLPKLYWAMIPAVVILTGAALYFGLREGETDFTEPSTMVVEAITEPINTESNTPVVQQVITSAPDEPTETTTSSITDPKAEIAAATNTPSITETTLDEPDLAIGSPIIEPTPDEPMEIDPLPVVEPSLERNLSEELITLPSLSAQINLTSLSSPSLIPAVSNPALVETPQKPLRKPTPKSFDIGLNITPDMVFYRNPSTSFKYTYTFDAGAKYNLGRFYFQSGLGVSYSTAIGDYAISYVKNDSVGYYWTVSSYSVEPGEPGVQFETKQVTVYDSVNYLYDYSTKNRYLYFQIPLNFGYRIIDKPRWRLSVEAGLLYAYLISIKEPAPTFYMPEARILDIQSRTPERNRHSLGLTGSVSIEYQFARNFYLLIEPTFKYYLQAIEESSSIGAKQPYSIGLRAGIWYRLNFKSKAK